MNIIKRFLKGRQLWFVRSMSGSKKEQLIAAILVIGFILLIIFLVEAFIIVWRAHYDTNFNGRFWDNISGMVSIFIDPGSVWNYDFWKAEIISDSESNPTAPSWGSLSVSILGMIVFVGFLVSSIYNMIARDIEKFREGRLHFYHKNHVVVIGFTDVVPMLVKQICKKGKNCDIIVQSAIATSIVKNKIFAELEQGEEKHVFIVNAKRDSQEELGYLCIEQSKEVYVIGDENEDFHDSMNLHCLDRIVEILKLRDVKRRIVCRVFFNNQNTYAAFQSTDIKEEWKQYIDFQAYNFYDEWARRLLVDCKWDVNNPPVFYPSLDRGEMGQNSQKHVHLVIIGMSNMGISVGTMASHMMHFPNFFDTDMNEQPENSTQITFIDSDAATEMNYFRGRISGYFDICGCTYRDFIDGDGSSQYIPPTSSNKGESFLDIRYEFIRANVEMPEIRKLLDQWANNMDEVLSIAVCLDDASKALAAGLYLPESIYWKGIPVFIRQASSAALLIQLGENADVENYRKYRKVYPFGMLDTWFDIEDKSLCLAKLINGVYDYCSKNMKLPSGEQLKGESEQKWKKLSIANQWSNLYASYSVNPKLRAMGILDNPKNIQPEQQQSLALMEHARWNMEKLLIGFRAPNPEELEEIMNNKDQNTWYKKRFVHSCIEEYKKIDEDAKKYDLNVVSALEKMIEIASQETKNNEK